MIKKLQRKFVIITAVCLLAVELLIIGAINIVNVYQINRENDNLLNIIIDNDGNFPKFKPQPDQNSREPSQRDSLNGEPPDELSLDIKWKAHGINEETGYQTRYFTAFVNNNGDVYKVDTGHISAIDSKQAVLYAEQAYYDDDETGYISNYKYKIADSSSGKIIVFIDCRDSLHDMTRFLIISAVIAFVGYVIVCLLVIVFSKRAVKPAIESMEKQRRFITDAGHEIKTPLAIISANTEVLEMTSEPNEWTESIKNQITRLNMLLQNLLNLSKLEEDVYKMNFVDFDISKAVSEASEPFKLLAQSNGKMLTTDIENGINFHGDTNAVKQLVSILADNAVKYADDFSDIIIKLKCSSNSKEIILSVSNTCNAIPDGDLNRFFDRFYRADESRSRKQGQNESGYGIGLSIARAITESHKGKISCKAENKNIVFSAVFKKK